MDHVIIQKQHDTGKWPGVPSSLGVLIEPGNPGSQFVLSELEVWTHPRGCSPASGTPRADRDGSATVWELPPEAPLERLGRKPPARGHGVTEPL